MLLEICVDLRVRWSLTRCIQNTNVHVFVILGLRYGRKNRDILSSGSVVIQLRWR